MSEGKTVSLEQQNWYMAEQQRRAAKEIKNTIRRNENTMRDIRISLY